MKQKTTEFAQVKIEKVGIKYVTAELTGSLKNYTAKLIKNSVIADVKTGDTIFLRVQDQSEISNHGTKLKFEPLELLTDPIVIEKYILADRKRVTEIYIKAANDNLDKGWYSGDAISNALIMISSQPSYKISNLEIRHKRLANIISACNAYKFRQTEKFLALCNEVIEIYLDEKHLGQLKLESVEADMSNILAEMKAVKAILQTKKTDTLSQLQSLIR